MILMPRFLASTLVSALSCAYVAGAPCASAAVSLELTQALGSQPLALVNPALQPTDLFALYDTVLCLEVTEIDAASRTVVLTVKTIAKGSFAAKTIRLTVSDKALVGAFQQLPEVGGEVVAFVGQQGHHREGSIRLYFGGEGRWQAGEVTTAGDAATPSVWAWSKDLGIEMYGTFNGHPAQLAELVRDCATGRDFFPATPFDQFKDDRVLARIAATGVALYDIDGDGRLDALAVGPAGSALLLQREPLRFTDVTAAAGLSTCSGHSVDCADVDSDGRVDLLIDGKIFNQDATGHFHAPSGSPALTGSVVMSRFVDVNHDGWPDVVATIDGVGIRVLVHPGTASGGAYADVTARLGFTSAGSADGYLIPGIYDGLTSLFIASGAGTLLMADAAGQFSPVARLPGWDFTVAGGGRTGGGACAPLWRADRFDLAFATDNGVNLVAIHHGQASDIGRFGNETQVATTACCGLLAEDLNADGHVDLYAISRAPGMTNNLYDNRGYGSFMVAERYRATVIPGQAHRRGALGAAAGDVDGDGTNDLLLATTDGTLTLLLNDVLAGRTLSEHPSRLETTLAGTGLLHVDVRGPRGVVGAKVSVADSTGRILGQRLIGGNAVTGCRGPDEATFAVREPGNLTVTIRWSDGVTRSQPIVVRANQRSTLRADRPPLP